MFKSLVLVACLACVGSALAKPAYTSKYDNVDVDEILKNDRLFNNYYKCLLDQGPCSADGSALKQVLPDAIATECAQCSDKQKAGAKKIFKYLIQKRPEQWNVLEAKYDPSGTYRAKYGSEIKTL